MKSVVFILCVVFIVGLGTMPSWGYEEIPVSNGGTLAGVVTLVGDVPKPKGYNLVTLPDAVYCGRISTGTGWRLLQTLRHWTRRWIQKRGHLPGRNQRGETLRV